VVSRKFAERYFPGENAIGHRIRRGGENTKPQPWVRIVGIAVDTNYLWIQDQADPAVYLNVVQMPPTQVIYTVSTIGDPLAPAPAVRRSLAAIDATVPIDGLQTYQQYLNEALAGLMYVAAWLVVDAFVGLLLAAIGIFGVMSNSVAERTREIGLRMAIGASRQQVTLMILRRAAILTAIGVATGITLAAVLARLSANLLFGVSATDPVIFISITVAVTAVALLVSWGPARRAASIDPMRALRAE
jgi:predicted lysophospholipase L1 biosynthesis ABC-type transport system permease subunit